MRVIHKYTLDYQDTVIGLPRGTKILSFQFQDDSRGRPAPCLWVLKNLDEKEIEKRCFTLIATGEAFAGAGANGEFVGRFIGTAQNPPLVWHLFEVT
jgi:hypothetical protein